MPQQTQPSYLRDHRLSKMLRQGLPETEFTGTDDQHTLMPPRQLEAYDHAVTGLEFDSEIEQPDGDEVLAASGHYKTTDKRTCTRIKSE